MVQLLRYAAGGAGCGIQGRASSAIRARVMCLGTHVTDACDGLVGGKLWLLEALVPPIGSPIGSGGTHPRQLSGAPSFRAA